MMGLAKAGIPLRSYWLWKLYSIEEYARYFADQDWNWSSVWKAWETQKNWEALRHKSRALLTILDGMTDLEVQQDFEWEMNKG
ncbi:MAG: hypothetical protein ACP5QA_16130, partial [Phycisphaerae bacterium]